MSLSPSDVRKALVETLREELTSGDPAVSKKLNEILLSAVIKDSTGTELFNFLKDGSQFSGTFSPSGAGNVTVISAVVGKVIRVSDFCLWNSGTGDVAVELYFGTSGKRLFKGLLASKSGVLKTYIRPWESNANDSLVLALSAAGICDYCIGASQEYPTEV